MEQNNFISDHQWYSMSFTGSQKCTVQLWFYIRVDSRFMLLFIIEVRKFRIMHRYHGLWDLLITYPDSSAYHYFYVMLTSPLVIYVVDNCGEGHTHLIVDSKYSANPAGLSNCIMVFCLRNLLFECDASWNFQCIFHLFIMKSLNVSSPILNWRSPV